MCGIQAWIKGVESCQDGHSVREGDGQAGQTVRSSSLDNPELFQEESPKKINRPGPADGQITCASPRKGERGPSGTGSSETGRCQSASPVGAAAPPGEGHLITLALPLPGGQAQVPVILMGNGHWEFLQIQAP